MSDAPVAPVADGFRAQPAFALPRPRRSLILHRGSLTRLLRSFCQTGFRVEVLHQSIARPTLEECRALAMDPRRLAWIREVRLVGDDEPWVCARTVMPLTTLTGPNRGLRRLGRTPLGNALFRRTPWCREQFALGHWDDPEGRPLWGRRSVFRRRGKRLLVTEQFQPAFWQRVAHHPRRYHTVRSDARRPL